MTTEAFSLEAYLEQGAHRAGEALERALDDLAPLLTPELEPVVRHGVLGGGKRLRPILCATAYRQVHGATEPPEAAWDLAASLELIHAYSLMHDDLPCMDDAALRRGHPTTHRVHGVPATVRAGAALIPAAALHAWRVTGRLGLGESRRRETVRTLMQAAGGAGMVGGQVLDLQAEGRQLTEDELTDLHARKTGALLAASVRLGGLAGGADDDMLKALEAYGRAVGLAFQIADDVLDATATAEALGKEPSDADLEKSTYVSLWGVQGARTRARDVAGGAVAALRRRGLEDPALVALADYVVARDR